MDAETKPTASTSNNELVALDTKPEEPKVIYREKAKRVRVNESDGPKRKQSDDSIFLSNKGSTNDGNDQPANLRASVPFNRTNSNPTLFSKETRHKTRAYSWNVLANHDSSNSGASSDSEDYEEIFDPSMVFMAIYRCYNWDSRDRIRKGKMFLTRSELFFKCSGMPFVKVRIRYSEIMSIAKLKNYKNGMDQVLSIKRNDNKSFIFYKFRLPKNIIKNMIETLKNESEEASAYDPVASEKPDSAKLGIRRISKPFANMIAKNAAAAAHKKEEKQLTKDNSDLSKSSKTSSEPTTPTTPPIKEETTKKVKTTRTKKNSVKDAEHTVDSEDGKANKNKSFRKFRDRFSQSTVEVAERPRRVSEMHELPGSAPKNPKKMLKTSSLVENREPKHSSDVVKKVVFPDMISESDVVFNLDSAPQELDQEALTTPTTTTDNTLPLLPKLDKDSSSKASADNENPKESHHNKKSSSSRKPKETPVFNKIDFFDQANKEQITNFNGTKVSYFNWISVFKFDQSSSSSKGATSNSPSSLQRKVNQAILLLSPLMVIVFFGMTILNFLKLESLERQLTEF